MTVTCLSCQNWRPRETDKGLAKLGFAKCVVYSRGPGHTFSGGYQRECEAFNPASFQVIEGRRLVYEERARTWPA